MQTLRERVTEDSRRLPKQFGPHRRPPLRSGLRTKSQQRQESKGIRLVYGILFTQPHHIRQRLERSNMSQGIPARCVKNNRKSPKDNIAYGEDRTEESAVTALAPRMA